MMYTSRVPRVTIRPVLAPLRSISVLMAMVEPWISSSIVAAGAVARKYLATRLGVAISGYVSQVGELAIARTDLILRACERFCKDRFGLHEGQDGDSFG